MNEKKPFDEGFGGFLVGVGISCIIVIIGSLTGIIGGHS